VVLITKLYHHYILGTRSHGQSFNAAAIPQKLAEEVAEYVHSKFYMDGISRIPEARLTKEEEEQFNICMSTGQRN
jgi:hypothetical protein